MAGILLRLRTWWETADRTQRAVTLFGGGFLLLLLLGTFYFASRPKMEMAFGGLSPAEQGTVVEEIQKLGIPVEFDLAGNVLVPSNKVSEVKMRLAANGSLPAASHWGYGDLEKMNNFSTPSVERERLKSIVEGELAKTIEFLQGVDSARVHVTLAQDAVLMGDRKPATASVTIAAEAGSSISGEQAKAIAKLVANSVPGLDLQNTTIIDNNLQPIWMGDSESSATGLAGDKLQAEITEGKRRERELQQKLDYFFGPGSTSVMVDLELDFNTETQKTTAPVIGEVPVNEAKATEVMSGAGSGAGAGGVAGTGSNIGAPGTPSGSIGGSDSDSKYENTQTEKQYAYGEKQTETQKSPGEVTSMAISVLVDTKKVQEPDKVREFVNQYLGPRAGMPNFTANITEVEKSTAVETAVAKAAEVAAGRDRLQQIFSFLPIGALLLVAVLILRGLGKAAKSSNVLVAALPGGGTMPMALGTRQTDEALSGVEAHASLPQGDHPAPQASQSAPAPTHQTFQSAVPIIDDLLSDIPARVNRPLEQIKKMTSDRPEVVAMLIKSWLLEERR